MKSLNIIPAFITGYTVFSLRLLVSFCCNSVSALSFSVAWHWSLWSSTICANELEAVNKISPTCWWARSIFVVAIVRHTHTCTLKPYSSMLIQTCTFYKYILQVPQYCVHIQYTFMFSHEHLLTPPSDQECARLSAWQGDHSMNEGVSKCHERI